MRSMGKKIRRARLRLALTLDELAQKSGVSKAYLSLIENGRLNNPPSDEKLQQLERALELPPNELVGPAHVQRTPPDVRAVLERLIQHRGRNGEGLGGLPIADCRLPIGKTPASPSSPSPQLPRTNGKSAPPVVPARSSALGALDLDAAYLSGVLQELADRAGGNVEPVKPNGVVASQAPVVNKVSAGYPSDFTDLSYPPRVADAYITVPGIDDPDVFAARVSGDSMSPKYGEGDIVVFSPAAPWKDGSDCFVRFEDGQTTFKRVYVEKNEQGQELLRLQPRNERYQPRVVPREQVAGVYKAVSVYRMVGD